MRVGTITRYTLVAILVLSFLILLAERFFLEGLDKAYSNIAFAVAIFTFLLLVYLLLRNLKQTEQDVNVSEALNRGILRSLTFPIAVLDLTGRVVTTNVAWNDWGKENAEASLAIAVKGSNYFEECERLAIAGDLVALKVLKGLRSVLNEQSPLFKMDYSRYSANKENWYNIRIVRFKDVENMIMISQENITATKLATLEREKMVSDIIERSNNLEQFSYIVSHNLRAPLANILGFVELLNSNLTPDEFGEVTSGMRTAACNLDTVVKDLNHVLHIKTHFFDKREPVYFKEIVGSISTSLKDVLKDANVEIYTDFASVEKLNTIKTYMYSIFYNIIYNSIKYKRPDSKTYVEVESKKVLNGFQLIFKDNGIGIDLKKNGEKLFGLYNRFNVDTQGKGIGLFMVKSKVEALGGKISVNSQVDKGTEFIVEFKNTVTMNEAS